MTYRRDRGPRKDPHDPVALAKKLPIRLRTFQGFMQSENGRATGLKAYLQEFAQWLGETLGTDEIPEGLALEVMRRGPGLPADWYRAVLGAPR